MASLTLLAHDTPWWHKTMPPLRKRARSITIEVIRYTCIGALYALAHIAMGITAIQELVTHPPSIRVTLPKLILKPLAILISQLGRLG